MPPNLFVSIFRCRETGNGFPRNHKKVSGGLRIYVIKGHALYIYKWHGKWSASIQSHRHISYLIILVYESARYFFAQYLSEYGVSSLFHVLRLLHFVRHVAYFAGAVRLRALSMRVAYISAVSHTSSISKW